MTYDESITLLKVTQTVTPSGALKEVLQRSEVYVQVKSVGYREFYQAAAAGLKPQLVFVMADFLEYGGQERLEYQGRVYDILRTYRKDGSNELEITVSGPVNSEVG